MTTERKLVLSAMVVVAVMVVAGCTSAPVTRPAWTTVEDAAGEPVIDAASGQPILVPMIGEDGQQVRTPVVRDGEVQYQDVIDEAAASSWIGAAAVAAPGIAPWAPLVLPLLLLLGGSRQRDGQ